MFLFVNTSPADDLHDCVNAMLRIADQLNVEVRSEFNGYKLVVCPGDSVEEVMALRDKLMKIRAITKERLKIVREKRNQEEPLTLVDVYSVNWDEQQGEDGELVERTSFTIDGIHGPIGNGDAIVFVPKPFRELVEQKLAEAAKVLGVPVPGNGFVSKVTLPDHHSVPLGTEIELSGPVDVAASASGVCVADKPIPTALDQVGGAALPPLDVAWFETLIRSNNHTYFTVVPDWVIRLCDDISGWRCFYKRRDARGILDRARGSKGKLECHETFAAAWEWIRSLSVEDVKLIVENRFE